MLMTLEVTLYMTVTLEVTLYLHWKIIVLEANSLNFGLGMRLVVWKL